MCEFVIAEVLPGKLNALVKNLMKQMKTDDPNEAVRRFNSGEWMVVKNRGWYLKDGVINFTVTSNGRIGEEWIKFFEDRGDRIEDSAKNMLRSDDFKPTSGVIIKVAVLKGGFFKIFNRTIESIHAEAKTKGYTKPNAELACLIREKFSDKEIEEMGLYWIITMHEYIQADGHPRLLYVSNILDGRSLGGGCIHADTKLDRDFGFAYAVPG